MVENGLRGEKRARLHREGSQPGSTAGWLGGRNGQQSGDLAQLSAGVADRRGNRIGALAGVAYCHGRTGLRIAAPIHLFQSLARAGKRISLGMNEPLYLQGHFNIAAAIEPLTSAALVGLELRELRLPESQHVGLNLADARNVANLEIKTVRDCGRFEGALPG